MVNIKKINKYIWDFQIISKKKDLYTIQYKEFNKLLPYKETVSSSELVKMLFNHLNSIIKKDRVELLLILLKDFRSELLKLSIHSLENVNYQLRIMFDTLGIKHYIKLNEGIFLHPIDIAMVLGQKEVDNYYKKSYALYYKNGSKKYDDLHRMYDGFFKFLYNLYKENKVVIMEKINK